MIIMWDWTQDELSLYGELLIEKNWKKQVESNFLFWQQIYLYYVAVDSNAMKRVYVLMEVKKSNQKVLITLVWQLDFQKLTVSEKFENFSN